MCFAYQDCLAERRDIDYITCRAIVLGVEVITAIEN